MKRNHVVSAVVVGIYTAYDEEKTKINYQISPKPKKFTLSAEIQRAVNESISERIFGWMR
ncbi:hypothetical protein BDF21DRAFT_429858 [Thamnidium elegans]|nr:hypothetical protein BDF21DRAFT_429858 [Thamnidium elegans]